MSPEFRLRFWREKEKGANHEGVVPEDVRTMIDAHHASYLDFLYNTRDEEYMIKNGEMTKRAIIVGKRLDSMNSKEKNAYVREYSEITGFPQANITSEKIISHVSQTVIDVANQLDAQLQYVGFSPTCSIGKGAALPGSDVDGFTAIVPDDKDAVREALTIGVGKRLNPQLVNPREALTVFTTSRMMEYIQWLYADDLTGVTDVPDETWSRSEEYYAEKTVLGISSNGALFERLTEKEKDIFKNAEKKITKTHIHKSPKHNADKHEARKNMLSQYPMLTPDEQFIIVRVLQISPEAIALNISKNSPYKSTFSSLKKKGLLSFDNGHLRADWAPYPWLFRNMPLIFDSFEN